MYESWITDPIAFIQYCLTIGYSPELQLDRINNDGNYEPGNLRFSTAKENSNNKENTLKFEFRGEIYTVSELASMCLIPSDTLRARLTSGWDVEKAMLVPKCTKIGVKYTIDFPDLHLMFNSIAAAVRHFSVVSYHTATTRIAKGWSPESAVSTPLNSVELEHRENPQSRFRQKKKSNVEKSNYDSIAKHPLYHRIKSLIGRCMNESDPNYPNYGGRGITVYPLWMQRPRLFIEYLESLGWEKGLSLDRIDNNGNYEPGNLKFSTAKEQANNRRSNFKIEVFGDLLTIPQALEKYGPAEGLKADRVWQRLKREGWGVEEAITTPASPSSRRTNMQIQYEGSNYNLMELVKMFGVVTYHQANHRIQRDGWDPIKAVSEPFVYRRKRKNVKN